MTKYRNVLGNAEDILGGIGGVDAGIVAPATTKRGNLDGFYAMLERKYGLNILEVPYAELIRIAEKPVIGYRTQLCDVYVAADYMGRMLTDKEKAAIAAHEAGHDMTKPDDETTAEQNGREILKAYGHDSVTLDRFNKMHEALMRSMN